MKTPVNDGKLAYIKSLDCVHCGLCTQECPTYVTTGRETANPRGRIYTMRALLEGRLEPTPDATSDLDLCLVCRACETACPSGVEFHVLMADARASYRRPGRFRRHLMKKLESPKALRSLARLMRFWQRSGLRFLRHAFPRRLKFLEAYLPAVPAARERRPLPAMSPAHGPARGRVALLEGCVMSLLFQDVNRDTMTLLQHAGFDVVVPEGQTCCGALHEHDGDLATSQRLLEHDARGFDASGAEWIVSNSSGCGAHLASHQGLRPRVIDIAQFLQEHAPHLRFRPFEGRVTLDAPCHLLHGLRQGAGPAALLARVQNLELVPMTDAERCCGAAGIYNLDHPRESQEILEPKLDALMATKATTLLTGNPGCLMQWRQGVARRGLEISVEHPATFLARLLEPPAAAMRGTPPARSPSDH